MPSKQPAPAWKCQGFTCSKQGNDPGENEDALAWNLQHGRFAIADGASESIGAKLWAQLLVEEFVRKPLLKPDLLDAWVERFQPKWADEMAGKELPWYAEEKAEKGAFATLLGLVVKPDGQWHALAVGDSCLFHVRDDALLAAFPIGDPDAFGTHPWLVGSIAPPEPTDEETRAKEIQGSWRAGDHLLLMTDALSAWFLRQSLDTGTPPVSAVKQLLEAGSDLEALSRELNALQEGQQMGNDDCALIAITFG